MLSSATSSLRSDDPYEQLIAQIIRIERQPQLKLEAEKTNQNRFKKVLGEFDSKLSALRTQLTGFADTTSNPFSSRSARSASDAFSITASERAAVGTHALQVERLATTDTRVSDRLASSGGTLRDFFDANGAQSGTIQVATPTSEDPDARSAISVNFDPTGATDEEILKEIATAIDTAMADAVADGTLDQSATTSASVVKETSGTARLSLRSGTSGYKGRLELSGAVFDHLGISRDALTSGTSGGQVTAVGMSEMDSELNSKFVLDGLTLYRDSNQVGDALEGMTINLEQSSEALEEFTVQPDAESIKANIEAFIESYNAAIDFIRQKSQVDGETGRRGDFAGDSSLSSLRFGLRNDAVRGIAGQPDGRPAALTDLGIEISNDGTLSLADEEALVSAVAQDPSAVQNVFAAEDGMASKMLARLDGYLGSDGLLDSREDGIDERVRRLDSRISDWDERLSRRENALRAQFAELQETVALVQGQQQFLNNFFVPTY